MYSVLPFLILLKTVNDFQTGVPLFCLSIFSFSKIQIHHHDSEFSRQNLHLEHQGLHMNEMNDMIGQWREAKPFSTSVDNVYTTLQHLKDNVERLITTFYQPTLINPTIFLKYNDAFSKIPFTCLRVPTTTSHRPPFSSGIFYTLCIRRFCTCSHLKHTPSVQKNSQPLLLIQRDVGTGHRE